MTEFLSSEDALPDSRDAVFVAEYVRSGRDAMLACARAGITDPKYPMTVLARRMLERADIQAAIAAAEAAIAVAPPVDVTRASISADLDKVFAEALDDGSYAAAVSAKKTQAQLLGFLETTVNVNHTITAAEMSDEDLMRIAKRAQPAAIEGEVVGRSDG